MTVFLSIVCSIFFERELYSLLTKKRQRFNLEVSTAWHWLLILFSSISFHFWGDKPIELDDLVLSARHVEKGTRRENKRERVKGRNRGAGATGWRLCVAIMLSAITRMKWGCQPANIAVVHHQVCDMTRRILKESWSVWKRGAVERRGVCRGLTAIEQDPASGGVAGARLNLARRESYSSAFLLLKVSSCASSWQHLIRILVIGWASL